MKFEYRYTTIEIIACGGDIIRRAIYKFWKWWLILPVFLAVISDIRWKEVFSLDQAELAALGALAWHCFVLTAGFLGLLFLAAVFLMWNRFRNTDLQMTVENGIFEMAVGESRWRYSCADILVVEKRGRFFAVEIKRDGRENGTFLLPFRVFAEIQDALQFMVFMERQRIYACEVSERVCQEGRKQAEDGADEKDPAEFAFEVQWNDQMIREVKNETIWIRTQKDFSTETSRLRVLLIGTIWLVMMIKTLISGDGGLFRTIVIGIILAVVLMLMEHKSAKAKPPSKKPIKRPLFASRTGGGTDKPMVSWIVVGNENILVKEMGTEGILSWKDMGHLLESGQWFLIYNKKKQPLLHFPKQSLGDEAEQQRFVKYCQERGLEYRLMGLPEGKKVHRTHEYVIWGTLAFLVTVISIPLIIDIASVSHRSQMESMAEEETTEYVFRTEDFEHYLPLEKQVAILKSLRIRVPEKLLKEEREWMAEVPRAQEWLEGEPFYTLLEDLGYPEWDEETNEVKSYSRQMYTISWDGYDLMEDYLSLLNGVNALSHGEYSLTSPAVILDGVDPEDLTGTVQIYFLLNGTPYLYDLRADGYYLDTAVLRCLNEAFGREKISGRLYGMDEDGWTCVIFYKDRDWAKEFTDKTGIPLFLEYKE